MGFWGFVKSLFGSKKHNNPRIVVWKNRNGGTKPIIAQIDHH